MGERLMSPDRTTTVEDAKARWLKAREFADVAALLFDASRNTAESPSAFITMAVHAGIAAADVICITRLGRYSPTGNHQESIALLERAGKGLGKHLNKLLGLKTKAGYSAIAVSASDVTAASRAYLALMEYAETL